MKRLLSKIYLMLMGLIMIVATPGCRDDLLFDEGGEEVTVRFTILPEAAATSTRSGERAANRQISDGSGVDMLIYAVYDENYNLLEQYSRGTDEELKAIGFDHGDGQTIKKVDSFPYTLSLTLKRGQKFYVAFWAQNHQTKAFDTSDLRKVEIIYGRIGGDSKNPSGIAILNNDEDRDVFCNTVSITPSMSTATADEHIYLYRPLAQINIGTSGYDYEIVTRNSVKKYAYSKIRINRAARYLDLVKDEVYNTTTDQTLPQAPEAFAVADLDYAKIPAYAFESDVPQFPSYTKYDWEYDPGFEAKDPGVEKSIYENEQFLRVKLDYDLNDGHQFTEDKDGDSYRDYANYNNFDNYRTETFKYLSMCYVLVPGKKDEGSVINNVKVWMATDEQGSDEIGILDIDQVPVQRNWRTNIVGNLLTERNRFEVKLDKDFAGEYNGWKADEDWEYSGQLYDGVYYDAANDVIEISNAAGLLWLQKMVNGNLTIRDARDTNRRVGDRYRYYRDTDTPVVLDTKDSYGFTQADFADKFDKIMKATHQDSRTGTDRNRWPTNGNFHFAGATVKLMADIDLRGIDWIPIGLDYKVAEFQAYYTLIGEDTFGDALASNRGFYGTFDGNGHTIYNLRTMRFSAHVDDDYIERPDTQKPRNYDALPWMGRGLFGSLGGNAVITNVRMQNVDIYGCNGVGSIAGIVYGKAVKITNCIVDGGSLTATPMYRNDIKDPRSRTFARGTYLGGIVGYFNTRGGEVTNCEVKNLVLKGYRQVGGLIGTIDRTQNGSTIGKDANSRPNQIANNTISNTVIIASQLHFPFGIAPISSTSFDYTEIGFGWGSSEYDLYSGQILGGDIASNIQASLSNFGRNNVLNSVTFSEVTQEIDPGQVRRFSTVRAMQLPYMPALSSWFTDRVSLMANYYGKPSANKLHRLYRFRPIPDKITGYTDGYNYPMNLPEDVEMAWVTSSGKVGVYVESVVLDGSNCPVGGRSVITVDDVRGVNDCAMFITARDRQSEYRIYPTQARYALPTEVRKVVVRGNPYAYTGIAICPNINMSTVVLDNVAVYDVFQTIAQDRTAGTTGQWPTTSSINPSQTTLRLNQCNLRGYTIPGPGWRLVDAVATTFERGTATGHDTNGEEYTYKVEAPTQFTRCYFKAPFIIDMTNRQGTVTFNNCYAAAASTTNMEINPTQASQSRRILITSNVKGEPVVTYER